jgi:hypothetical protein
MKVIFVLTLIAGIVGGLTVAFAAGDLTTRDLMSPWCKTYTSRATLHRLTWLREGNYAQAETTARHVEEWCGPATLLGWLYKATWDGSPVPGDPYKPKVWNGEPSKPSTANSRGPI